MLEMDVAGTTVRAGLGQGTPARPLVQRSRKPPSVYCMHALAERCCTRATFAEPAKPVD